MGGRGGGVVFFSRAVGATSEKKSHLALLSSHFINANGATKWDFYTRKMRHYTSSAPLQGMGHNIDGDLHRIWYKLWQRRFIYK
ncbi:hypothetical protein KFK09_019544 [Dendrobium nobile]|uniref:Uncharacterized protein n=1 Tax=Dendrobium nobile TaxID=94219 RepID=A0A8T3ARJ7_DENNO|nr:hypothetical protein KFK09_019544 [Dendrobium nobile]